MPKQHLPPLTRDEKQAELKKVIAMVSATLDYLLDHYTGSIIYDDFDPAKDYYQQQKTQAEKYYKQRRLDRLKQQFIRLKESLKQAIDLQYQTYLKDVTGYEIDLFEDERQRIEKVRAKGKIDSEEESSAVSRMLGVLQRVPDETKNVKELTSLLNAFYTSKSSGDFPKKRKVKSEVIKTEEKEGIIKETIRITFGSKPKHLTEREAIAPDGKRKLMITEWSDGKHALTTVSIFCNKASGPIYSIDGIHTDIYAYWKDKNRLL